MKLKLIMGQELPKESWLAAADDLQTAAPYLAEILKNINHEGKGNQDAEEFLAEMQLAILAMHHVANFATDKCRVVPI